jgi:hypothetical protein
VNTINTEIAGVNPSTKLPTQASRLIRCKINVMPKMMIVGGRIDAIIATKPPGIPATA